MRSMVGSSLFKSSHDDLTEEAWTRGVLESSGDFHFIRGAGTLMGRGLLEEGVVNNQ